MRNLVPRYDGVFYQMGDGFVVLNRKVGPCVFRRGTELKLNSMFSMWELWVEGEEEMAGFFLYTAMKVRNGGGFLITFMESKRGKAKEGGLIIRNDHVMVYDFPGCGSLAISTKVNPRMLSVLMEQ